MAEDVGRSGDWGVIHFVLLAPEERTASLPADTRRVPLEARLKGFLRADARVGEQVEIETVLGRRATGTLTGLFTPPGHTFGRPVPELLSVGRELRALLARSATDDA